MILLDVVKSNRRFALEDLGWFTVCDGYICDADGKQVRLTIKQMFSDKWEIEKEWYECDFKKKYPTGVLCFARNDSEWKKDIITDYEVGRIYPFRGTRNNWIYTKFLSKNEIPVILTKED